MTGMGLSMARLGRIVEEAASEVYVFSADNFRFRLVNKGARDNLGYSIEELSLLTPWDLKPRISQTDFLKLIEPLANGSIPRLDFQTVHRRKDGTEYDVDVRLQLYVEEGDRVFYAAIQDITQRLQVEANLRALSSKLDVILDNTTMAVFVMDERQHCTFMNRAAEVLTGYTLAETAGRPLHDVIHHTHPDGSPFPISDCPIDRAFPERARTQGEEVFVHKDGTFYPVAFTASPLRNDSGVIIGTIIEARDIAEDRRNKEVRELLMREVDHRSRNILAIVHSLLTLTSAEDLPSYKRILAGRLSTLARAQTSLANRDWQGGSLRDVVVDELCALCAPNQLSLYGGPEVELSPDQVQPLSLLLHELATNANKYGACRIREGRVTVNWEVENREVRLIWREIGGPPVIPPARQGFGSTLKATVVQQINGAIAHEWLPTGLVVTVVFPV